MFDCEITVKGDGRGKYGVPKTDRVGPLRGFLVDNNVFYIAVTKHLKNCRACSIEGVLREYLRRRVEIPKFEGKVGTALANRALILENLAAKKQKRPVPVELVNEFLWRAGPYGVVEHGARLSLREKMQAFQPSPSTIDHVSAKLTDQDRYLAGLVKSGLKGDLSEADIEELVKVAEVMLS